MAQAAFAFESISPIQCSLPAGVRRALPPQLCNDPTAFEIGWDFAHHRLTPPVAHLHAESPVHHGWRAGRSAFGPRTLRATAAVRQWLQLRLAAWAQGRLFEGIQVTPQFLRQIDVAQCPVTREALTHHTDSASDADVGRVFDGAGYAAGNLAVTSRRVQQAKAQRSWNDAQACAQQIEAARIDELNGDALECGRIDGLNAIEWQRLAVLMSLATPLPHSVAAMLPLSVLPPNRLRVLNPVQALQVMLTLQFTRCGYARRVVALAALMPDNQAPDSQARQAFQVFMHTLLARRLAVGDALDELAMRRAMEDSWGDSLVLRRWQRLALRLTAADCEQLLQRALRRGLAGGAAWLSAERATDGWGLESGGWVQLRVQRLATCGSAVGPATSDEAVAPMPGNARNLGSQKAANCAALTARGAFQ